MRQALLLIHFLFLFLLLTQSVLAQTTLRGGVSNDPTFTQIYAGQDPLKGKPEVMPPMSTGKCVPPAGWILIYQSKTSCYYFAPFAVPLQGRVITPEEAGKYNWARCGAHPWDNQFIICFGTPTPKYNAGVSSNGDPPGATGPGGDGGPGGNGGSPGLSGGIGRAWDPCHPYYDMSTPAGRAAALQNAAQTQQACNQERCKHNPTLSVCGGPPVSPPPQPRTVLKGGVQTDCIHLRRPYQGRYALNNAQDMVQHLFDNYGTGKPIEITKVANRANTYMVLLAGTEFGSNQANMVSVSNPFEPLTNSIRQAFQQGFKTNAVTFAQNLSDLMGQRALMNTVTSLLRVEVASSQGRQTAYQQDILRAVTQQVPRGANVIVVGHSLGGMDGENLLSNATFQKFYNPIELVTYGSPITQSPVPRVRYVRYSSPTDLVRLASIRSWNADPAQWIYVHNPGENPTVDQFLRAGPSAQLQLLQTVVDGAMAAHLKYTISPDLAKYTVLDGTQNTGTSLLLDATDDHCYDAPLASPQSGAK